MKRTLSVAIVAAMVAGMMFTGCSQDGVTQSGSSSAASAAASTASAAAKTGKLNMTLILKNLTNPTWVAVKQGAMEAAAKEGVNLTVLAPTQSESNEEQISEMEQSITKKQDAIILVPADSAGIVPGVEKANEANIPVIDVNTKVDTSSGAKIATFIACDNYSASQSVAEKLSSMMNQKGTVIILEGKAGAQSSVDIVKGANDTFKKYSGIKVVASQTADWDRSKALTVTQNLLQAHPDVSAIFAANDEMAMGAVQAVAQVGKTGKILVTGLDAEDDAKKAVDAGTLAITCDKNSHDQGYYGVQAAVKVCRGESVDSTMTVTTSLYLKK